MERKLEHNCNFDDIIKKIMKSKSFTVGEICYITNILNWAKEKRCPLIVNINDQGEDEKIDSSIFFTESIKKIERKLNFDADLESSQKNTNPVSYKGKTLGENGVQEVRARNLEITYPDGVDFEEAKEKIKNEIKGSTINRIGELSFRVHRGNKIWLSKTKKLEVQGKAPIIRTFSYDMLKGNLMKNSGNMEAGAIAVSEFLKDMNDDTRNKLEFVLKESLENLRVLYYSEYIISCVFFGYLSTYGVKTGWKNLKIYSIDTKMEEWKLENKVENFRCDLVIFFYNVLYIIEFKFKYNRPENMGKVAIECISEKRYGSKVSNFIQINYPDEFKQFKSVSSVGIGYVIQGSTITCNVEYFSEPLSPLKDDELEHERDKIKKIKETNAFLRKKRKTKLKMEKKMEEEEEFSDENK